MRPNADGTYGEYQWVSGTLGTRYEVVDDVTPDEDDTHIRDNTLGVRDTFNLPDIPSSWQVSKVTVYVRARNSLVAYPTNINIMIRTHGTDYFSDDITLTGGTYYGAWNDYSWGWLNNPYTGAGWTVDEVNALEAGVRHTGPDSRGQRVTQVYVEVTYKAPTTITVDTNPRTVNKIGTETTKISGYLTSDGTGLEGGTVKLYYQYASTEYGTPDGTWTHIADVTTGTGGYYEHNWNPDDTLANGYYWIKAVFEGDTDYLGSSATTGVDAIPNLFVIPEGPLGTMAGLASMMLAFVAVMLHKRLRLPLT